MSTRRDSAGRERSPRSEIEIEIADTSRPQSQSRRSEVALRELAQDQHGVLTSAQLSETGLGPRAARHRVAVGRLRRLQRGVFAVETPTVKSTWMAAALVAGPGALLSHRSAAALWGLISARPGEMVSVTLPRSPGRRRPGMRFHCCTTLDDRDRAEVEE